MKKLLPILLVSFAALASSHAATIFFNLQGKAGTGLLSGNENVAVINGSPGTGGEAGAGISYDDVSDVLTINVAWGSTSGFANLTGEASLGHIHGPTASGGVSSFTENANVLFNLDDTAAWNANASSGGITNRTLSLTETQEGQLLAGRYYINIHTNSNSGGEIRGNLVVVPEPTSAVLAVASLGLLALRRRPRAIA